MRLVIDGQRLTADRTGVGRCLEGLLDDWSQTGWPLDDVLLVLRSSEGVRPPGLKALVVGEGWPGLAWEVFGLGRALRKGDLLFAPANLSPPNWFGPTVLVIYDTLPWSPSGGLSRSVRWRFKARYRLAARRARRVIVPSEATAGDVRRVHNLNAERLSVVYPGPEPGFAPAAPGSTLVAEARDAVGLGDAPYFLFVGKRSARRNVPAILEGLRWVRSARPEVRLVFVGPGGGDALPGPEAGVIDGGHVSEPVLRGLMAGAVGLLYPSLHEGFGLPVVEAQASGCPVVTLNNSALAESAGGAAVVLDAPEPEALARSMERLMTEPGWREGLVLRGLENARRFSRSSFADGVKRVIREVAAL